MAYLADPGGVFASDAHRRVLGHLLQDDAQSVEGLLDRIGPDVGSDFDDTDELTEVLEDLEADGFASKSQQGWKLLKKGLDALTAPVGGDS